LNQRIGAFHHLCPETADDLQFSNETNNEFGWSRRAGRGRPREPIRKLKKRTKNNGKQEKRQHGLEDEVETPNNDSK
jgi:hypothetical protein